MTRNGSLAALAVALGSLIAASSVQAQEKANSWSGYVLKNAHPAEPGPPIFSEVSATWTQPVVSCPVDGARVSFWVGIDGFGTPTVEQAGTVAVCGAANQPPLYYKSFWEMYAPDGNSRGGEPFVVSPGDIIKAGVQYVKGSYKLVLDDVTSHASFAKTEFCGTAYPCKRATAEWIVERPGGQPLADYGKVEFSNTRAVSSTPPGRDSIEMVHANTALSLCEPVRSAKLSAPSVVTAATASGSFICHWMAAE